MSEEIRDYTPTPGYQYPRNLETGGIIYDFPGEEPTARQREREMKMAFETTGNQPEANITPPYPMPEWQNVVPGISAITQPAETIDIKVESLSGGKIKVYAHISNSTRDYLAVVDDTCAAYEAAYQRAYGFMSKFFGDDLDV